MNKEELIKLKEKLAKLSIEEQKQRDLYLRKLSKGELQGPMTGYASIDKPSLQFYREQPVKEIKSNQTIYQMVFDQENMDVEAIGYLGVNWTFRKLKEEVDKCADAFVKDGIKFGDTILMGLSNTPETIVALLAINKIGAVSKWFDLRANELDIEAYLKTSNCKYMVAFDMILPKVKNVIDKTGLKRVYVMSPVGTLSNIKRNLYNLKQKISNEYINIPKDKRYVDFTKFKNSGDKNSKIELAKFDENKPSVMIQSSGTTGKPKTIVHSDKSAIEAVKSLSYSDLPLGKNKSALVALPPWIAYCLGEAILYPLALGSKVELCPNFDPDSVFKNIGKFTISFAAPFHYRYLKEHLIDMTSKQEEDFKKVECLISGGDKVTVEENKEWEEAFNTVVVNGYGNNEGWGALSVNPTRANKYGTVGIAKYGEVVASYDIDTGEELKYGEVGEICSLAKTQFLEYENNTVSTSEVKKTHADGKTWLHTGDLGYIDDQGYIHLEGRARRVIVRLGFKISAYTIEDNISQNDCVKECVAVAVKDEFEEHVPMAYITLKDNYDAEISKKLILARCEKTLKEYEIPKYLKIVESLPYTQNGKYDFRSLEQLGNEYVDSLQNGNKKEKIMIKK